MPCCRFQVTEAISSSSGSGTVAQGFWSYSIANVGGAAGTVGGVSLPDGATVYFEAPEGYHLSGIAYDATGTTFIITTIHK